MTSTYETKDASPGGLFGDTQPDVVACAHSHAYSLLAALDTGTRPPDLRAAVAYAADLSGGATLDEEYWALVRNAGAGGHIVVVWNGNQHKASFLLRPDPPFRVLSESGRESDMGEGQWVTRSTLREYFRPSGQET